MNAHAPMVVAGGELLANNRANHALHRFILGLSPLLRPRVRWLSLPHDRAASDRFREAMLGLPCEISGGRTGGTGRPDIAFVHAPDIDAALFAPGALKTLRRVREWNAAGTVLVLGGGAARAAFDHAVEGERTVRGLAWLPGSVCLGYNQRPTEQATFQRLIGSDALPNGLAVDAEAALSFIGQKLHKVAAASTTAGAWRVERSPNGLSEIPLPLTVLAAPQLVK